MKIKRPSGLNPNPKSYKLFVFIPSWKRHRQLRGWNKERRGG